jgi:hypothetical protein
MRRAEGVAFAAPTTRRVPKRMRAIGIAAVAPRSWASTKAGTCEGAIPVNVLESERAIVMAGDEVNQYAAPIQPATIQGASYARQCPRITSNSPNVATNSANH